jgi:hypothetical protein
MNQDTTELDLAWAEIQEGLRQEKEADELWTKGHAIISQSKELRAKARRTWIEGSIKLAQFLHAKRKEYASDQDFGAWLAESGYGDNHISRHDRAALIKMGEHPDVTHSVLEQTTRRSWQLIWREEIQPRLEQAARLPSPEPIRQPPDRAELPAPTDRADLPAPTDRADLPAPTDRADLPAPTDRADLPAPTDRAEHPSGVASDPTIDDPAPEPPALSDPITEISEPEQPDGALSTRNEPPRFKLVEVLKPKAEPLIPGDMHEIFGASLDRMWVHLRELVRLVPHVDQSDKSLCRLLAYYLLTVKATSEELAKTLLGGDLRRIDPYFYEEDASADADDTK